MTTKTPMELADEIEQADWYWSILRMDECEWKTIISTLRQSARREALLREAMSYLPHFTEFLKRIEQALGETS